MLNQEFGITREVCRALTVYFEGQQKERMNRILYILTVTTTILAPMQVHHYCYSCSHHLSRSYHVMYDIVNDRYVWYELYLYA
jgi:hypothetical protein